MRAKVTLNRINGYKDRKPRLLVGEPGVTIRERSGRTVRTLSLFDKSAMPPTLAELWEPTILTWNDHMIEFQGYEDNEGKWTVQTWHCQIDRS